ncbi:unannotated protein [freshwater metagenome]|uniref:Unannotated protein n=1 Tax=freshwater metagenome TaxID=449393 RepID=A0A6J6EYJ8_9ZZZZ
MNATCTISLDRLSIHAVTRSLDAHAMGVIAGGLSYRIGFAML